MRRRMSTAPSRRRSSGAGGPHPARTNWRTHAVRCATARPTASSRILRPSPSPSHMVLRRASAPFVTGKGRACEDRAGPGRDMRSEQMPEVSEYAPGTPSWVDLASPDPDASARFYGGLFGWEATDPGPVEESGGYRMLQRDGRNVAGLGPTQGEGQPAMWTTYVSTDDAEAVAAKVREAGGRVMMDPFDVLGAGRMAVFVDPAGAYISVWQPQDHHGADVVNEPGSLCWNELATRDIDQAKAFYGAAFGW